MKCLQLLEFRLFIIINLNVSALISLLTLVISLLISDLLVYHVSRADNRIGHRGDSCVAESHNRSPPRNHNA